MIRLCLTLLLSSVLGGCKAQLPTFVNNPMPSEDATAMVQVEWYNRLVKVPKFDTVSVFKTPAFSKIRYVIVRPERLDDVARVETKDGKFLYFLSGDRFYFDQVNFDEKGTVTSGLSSIQISGCKLIVQYEECNTCKFGRTKGGT